MFDISEGEGGAQEENEEKEKVEDERLLTKS